MAFLITTYRVPVPSGTWVDESSDFYLTFLDDSTYMDSEYNTLFQYRLEGDTLSFTDAAGQSVSTQLVRNFGGKIRVVLNGVERTLVPSAEEMPKAESLSTEGMEPITAYESRNTGYSEELYLRLYDQNIYTVLIGTDQITGRYATATNGNLYLYDSVSKTVDCLVPTIGGYATCPLVTTIEVDSVKSNAIEDGSLTLQGEARAQSTGISYSFSSDNIVTVTLSAGDSLDMNYYCDADGFIALSDSYGACGVDYMYYDKSTGTLYKNVLVEDSWFTYLQGLTPSSNTEE